MILYGLAHCSTTKKAYDHLVRRGVAVSLVDYRVNPLTKEQLFAYHNQSGQPITAWLNTTGQAYRERKDELAGATVEEILTLMANEPMLLKRPLLVSSAVVQAGYREAFYDAL
jgi:arsenate reductase (glutaredoxin)